MVVLFRTLTIMAIAFLLVGAVLPFDRPLQIDVDLNQPPPAWLALSSAFLLIALAALVASGALLLFRPWGRWVIALASLGGLVVAWLMVGSPIAESLSLWTNVLFALSALAWLIVLAISYHPTVSARFRHDC